MPGGFSPPSSPSSVAYAAPLDPPGPPGEWDNPADPDGPATATWSPDPAPDVVEGPKTPWWAEEPDPVSTAGEAGLDGADVDDEAAARRTTPVVPPSPGTLVAGPGVPSVDTRRAIPPEPLVDTPQPQHPETEPDGLPITAESGTTVPPAAEDRPGVTRPEGIATFWGPPVTSAEDPSATGEGAGEAFGPVGVSFDSLGTQGPVTVTLPAVDPSGGPAAPWPAMGPASGPMSGGPHPPMAPFGTAHDPAGPPPGVLASAYQPPTWPADPGTPGSTEGPGGGAGGGGNRRLLLIGGGVAGAVLVAALVLIGVSTLSGGSPAKKKTVAHSAPATQSPPGAVPSGSQPPATTPSGPKGPKIDNEKTDPQALALTEVFPSAKLSLGGRDYEQDRTSVNHRCSLAARGAMAKALQQGHCSSIVRATYVDGTKKYAVTTGIAVLPTRVAALAANKAGDPSHYEWFRGLQGKLATKIDQAGGYAASTVRGRYIVYAYAQYADGTKPQPDDATLKALSRQFVGYALRPIIKRAQ
jgi:hypothetical protein